MATATFEKQGSTLTVKPEGRIDTLRTPQLDNELKTHLDGVENVVMDFEKVEFICSSFLRLLLWLEKKMEAGGGEVTIIHANDITMTTLEVTGFMGVVHVITD